MHQMIQIASYYSNLIGNVDVLIKINDNVALDYM